MPARRKRAYSGASYMKRRRGQRRNPYFAKKQWSRGGRTFHRNARMVTQAPWLSVRSSALTGCARDYLEVLYNPFKPRIKELPCIPDWRQMPSQKFYLRKRFTFTTFSGTTGAGDTDLAYVVLNPYTIAGSIAGGTNEAIAHTNGGGAAAATVVKTQAGAGITELAWDSNFAEAFANNSQGNKIRVVAAGIRVSYAGKFEELQGTFAVYKHPQNLNSGGTSLGTSTTLFTFDHLLQEDSTAYGALSHNTELFCEYHPINATDFDYLEATDRGYIMAIVIQCPSTFGEVEPTFMAECIAWYELIGPGAVGAKSGHSDPQGLGQISAVYTRQEPEKSGVVKVAEKIGEIAGKAVMGFGSGLKRAWGAEYGSRKRPRLAIGY